MFCSGYAYLVLNIGNWTKLTGVDSVVIILYNYIIEHWQITEYFYKAYPTGVVCGWQVWLETRSLLWAVWVMPSSRWPLWSATMSRARSGRSWKVCLLVALASPVFLEVLFPHSGMSPDIEWTVWLKKSNFKALNLTGH